MVEMVTSKDTPQGAGKLLSILLEGCVDKLESMALVLDEVLAKIDRATAKSEDKSEGTNGMPADVTLIEKARPIASATYAVEKPEELLIGKRCLLHITCRLLMLVL